MQSWKFSNVLISIGAAVLVTAGTAHVVLAESSSSPNFEATEMQFGVGSTIESCSDEYCAQATIGDIAVGRSEGGTSTAEFGSVTPEVPSLEVIIDPGVTDLGVLSIEETSYKESIIRVRSYLSNGYVLQIIGDPPRYDSHTLAAPSEPTVSTPGVEQFGLNLAANTTPQLGAEPVQVPSTETSFGFVEEDYASPNLFTFTSGDIVARSLTESGRTEYTLSMIINVAGSTPAGHFVGDYSAVVVPVY